MGSDGNTNIDDQTDKKWLASLALDAHPTDNLLLQLNASSNYNRIDGRQEQFYFDNLTAPGRILSAPDNSKLWSPEATYDQVQNNNLGLKTTYHVNDIFTFRAGVSGQWWDWKEVYPTTGGVTDNGTYDMTIYGTRDTGTSYGEYAYLDAIFDTFGVAHKLTFGTNGYAYAEKDGPYIPLGSASAISFSDPASANISIMNYDPDAYRVIRAARTDSYNYMVGDDIKFNNQWSALVGANYSDIIADSYDGNGALTTSYNKFKATPSASLLFKPIPWITTYATYIEALEQGAIVPTTYGNYTNAGQTLAPYVDHQYEVGAKATVGGMLLTAALFQIDKANTFSRDNGDGTQTLLENGREVHKGIEFTASGKATADLTLFGGFTFFDAKVENAAQWYAQEGKIPDFVSEQMAKLYAEYNLPFLKGLTLTGGVYYTGKFYVDPANTQYAPAVVLADVGARYTTTIYGKTTIYRLNVTNVTNENYWIGGPLGIPRAIAFSATVKF